MGIGWRRRNAGALWLVLGWAAMASAQATLKVESRIVLLDVSVTDAKGQPVADLRRDEFHVFEKGVQQTIVSFEAPEAHALPHGVAGQGLVNGTDDLAKIGQAPVTLLILDELNMSFADRAYAKTELMRWLARQPVVLAQPTELLAVTYTEFHLLRDYTQNRDELLAILKKHSGGIDWRRESTGRVGAAASENMFASLGALEQVAQATRGIPGRKNVLWVGNGFPTLNAGDVDRAKFDEIAAALRRESNLLLHARVTLSVIGESLKTKQPTTIEAGSNADPASTGDDASVLLTHGDLQFNGLAARTGGRVYGQSNDLDGEIGQAVADGQSYYTLSYRPGSASNDPKKYRTIRVETTRPGLTVQTRDGYFEEAKPPAIAAKVPTQQLAFDLFGAALSTIPYTDLHLSVVRKDGADFVVRAAVRDITWRDLPDGRRHTDMVMLAVCLSSHGRMLAKTSATLGATTEVTQASIDTVSATLPIHVVAPAGTARIRFVVRDMESGRVGTVDFTP